MVVALSGRRPGGIARHGARPGRHDYGCFGRAPGDLAIDAVLVIRAVGCERGNRTCLIKQGADLRGVIDVAGAQRGRDDPPAESSNLR